MQLKLRRKRRNSKKQWVCIEGLVLTDKPFFYIYRLMNFKEHPVEAGQLIKVHGVHGGMVVYTHASVDDPEVWPTWCFIRIDGGLVPFKLLSDDCYLKDDRQVVVFLDGVNNPESCDPLLNKLIYFPEGSFAVPGGEGFPLSSLSGYRFRISGEEGFGVFVAFIDIPSNELLSIDWMGKQLLVPARDEFIGEIDESEKLVWLNLPDGLLDLN